MSAHQPSQRPPKRMFVQEPASLAVSTTPRGAAKSAFTLCCRALQYLNKDQSIKQALRFSELLHTVTAKLDVYKKFEQVDFVPKPIRFKPLLNASSKVKETTDFKDLVEQETDLIKTFQIEMTSLMKQTAGLELTNASNEALSFTVNFVEKLTQYHLKMKEGDSGDPTLTSRAVHELLKEKEFKHLRFNASDQEINLIVPDDTSVIVDIDILAEIKNDTRPRVRDILLAAMNEYENNIKTSKKMDEIFELFEESRMTQAAEDMVLELDDIEAPVPKNLMDKILENVDKHLQHSQPKGTRGANNTKSASLKKKSSGKEKKRGTQKNRVPTRNENSQKEEQRATTKGAKNSKKGKKKQHSKPKHNGS